jgi:hypothetical protein
MSRSTISTFKLFELIPDETAAITYLEGRLWKAVCGKANRAARGAKVRSESHKLDRKTLTKPCDYLCHKKGP